VVVDSPFDIAFAEKRRVAVHSKNIVVLDASSHLGGDVVSTLRGGGHSVHAVQPEPCRVAGVTWYPARLEEPHHATAAIAEWVGDGLLFDGVCACPTFQAAGSPTKLTFADLSTHVTANVLTPLLMVLHLAEFELLYEDARVVFCVPPDEGPAVCRVSRGMVEPAVRIAMEAISFPYECRFFSEVARACKCLTANLGCDKV